MQNKFYTQVQVQEPCHQPWSEMTPNEQGRHCNACALTVIDFTNCTDAELFEFFSVDRKQRVCGRFKEDQLSKPLAPIRTRWGWLRAAASLLLPFVIQSEGEAQTVDSSAPPKMDTGKTRVVKRPPVLGIAIPNKIQPAETKKPPSTEADPRQTKPVRKEPEVDRPRTGTKKN